MCKNGEGNGDDNVATAIELICPQMQWKMGRCTVKPGVNGKWGEGRGGNAAALVVLLISLVTKRKP